MSKARIFGIVLALLGVVAAIFPDWFVPLTRGPAEDGDVYAAVERRIRGGMLLGVALSFIAIPALRPWSISVPSVIFYFMTGALAARMLGIIVDGATPKQWFLVAVEVVFMALAAVWLWRFTASVDTST